MVSSDSSTDRFFSLLLLLCFSPATYFSTMRRRVVCRCLCSVFASLCVLVVESPQNAREINLSGFFGPPANTATKRKR